MSTILESRWAGAATDVQLERAARALNANNIDAVVVDTPAEARHHVLGLIPEGAEVHSGASETLNELGITDALETSGRYAPVRPRLRSMDRATAAGEMRKLGAAPDYMLASPHAVTEDGRLVIASKGGSQLGPIISGAGRVILVAGAQKVVQNLDAAFRRVEEHSLPLEDARARAAYGVGSAINKVAIVNAESEPGRINVIIIRQPIGY